MPIVQLKDSRVCYRSRGQGSPALILIHGAAGGAHVWVEQFGPLSRNRHVVALDLPGHGCAEPLSEISIEVYARVVLQLTDALELDRFVLLGHSMGGAVAQLAALGALDKVAGLVLAATGARLPVSDLVFQAIDTNFDSFGELLGTFAFSPRTDRELVRKWTEPPLLATQSVVRADFEACNRFDLRDRLEEIHAPTLVLWGQDDQMVSKRRAESLAGRIQGARFKVIPGVGHMLFQEDPKTLNGEVEAFLGEVGRGMENG